MIPDWAVNVFIQVPTVGAIIILVLALQRGERDDRAIRDRQWREFINARDQHWRDFFNELTVSWHDTVKRMGERIEDNTQIAKENHRTLIDHDTQAREFIARSDPAIIQTRKRRKFTTGRR